MRKARFYLCLILIWMFTLGAAPREFTLGLWSKRLDDYFAKVKRFNRGNVRHLDYVDQGTGQTERIKVKKIIGVDWESAQILIKEAAFSVEAVYADAFSAYPGEVSQEVVCNDAYKPVFKEKKDGDVKRSYYLLYSNARFGIGACHEDLVAYRQLMGWIYCPEFEELNTINYYAPLDYPFEDMEAMFLEMICYYRQIENEKID